MPLACRSRAATMLPIAIAPVLFAAGCGGLGPVARPPWVEDYSLDPGTKLVVRYRQPARESFRYVLRSGAYWAGPIRGFIARVNDPGRRVTRARLDGVPPQRDSDQRLSWKFTDYEPEDALTLELD